MRPGGCYLSCEGIASLRLGDADRTPRNGLTPRNNDGHFESLANEVHFLQLFMGQQHVQRGRPGNRIVATS
jgi:hypothetical protein